MKITSTVQNAAIIVSLSDDDINIVVDADGVFSPLPISALGTKYILPSTPLPNYNYRSLLLIATHNMTTTVYILFRMNGGSVNFLSYSYRDGDKLSLKLNPYQTLKMSTRNDLNGTVITSDHSIAVYSGMEYSYRSTVYDQLLPVTHFGQEYVVAVDDTKLDLQIISEHSHVQITFSSWATVSTGERRLYNRSLERGESLHFTTTRPVLVTLSRADGYSSSFTTVPPVHSYVTHRGVWLFYYNLHTKLRILTDRRATVLIKDKQLNDLLTWVDIPGSKYKVSTLVQSQSRSVYFTSISSDFPFTVVCFYNGSVYTSGNKVSAEEPLNYTGGSYLMALAVYFRHDISYVPRIFASAGETGGQWQVQDPHTGRVWSRRLNPYNTDLFFLDTTTTSVVLVHVRYDAIQIRGGMNSHTPFSPLPVSALGTKYIMSSCLPAAENTYRDTSSHISVLVIATHSKMVNIDVIFRLDGNVTYDNVTYDGRTYIDGDTLSVRLDRYETFSVNSSSDMTGTIVNATDTVAVYSGTYDERNNVFTTFEQLLPVKHYGHEYILSILDPYRHLPHQLQVVTEHTDMNIMFNNGSSISVGEDRVYRKQCGNPETFHFNTTRPVMATLCVVGRYYLYDALLIVPPANLYSTITTQQYHGTMQILIDQEYIDVQQMYHSPRTVYSPPVTWKNVSGTRFKVGTLRSARYTTVIRSNSTFGLLGYSNYYIYNGGYSFGTYPDTETSTPDGSSIKLNTSGSIQAGSSNNAAVTVGVVCGIVIVALIVAFVAYMLYRRRKKMPDIKAAEQDTDAPSTSMAIYAVPDRVDGCAAGEGMYTGMRFKATPNNRNTICNNAAYEDEPTE